MLVYLKMSQSVLGYSWIFGIDEDSKLIRDHTYSKIFLFLSYTNLNDVSIRKYI